MPRALHYLFSAGIVALLVGGPLAYSSYRQARLRAFHVVEEGVLYRSGQLSLDGLKRLIHDHGIKTVVTLRDAPAPGLPPPDLDEENYCRAQELNHAASARKNSISPTFIGFRIHRYGPVITSRVGGHTGDGVPRPLS